MPTKKVFAGRWLAGLALIVGLWLAIQVGAVLAAGPESFSLNPAVAQQLPTPTPFRFLTPTPFVPGGSTTTTTTSTAPRAGGFPMELALPVLAGGLAAIGGGSFVLRRKSTH